jgi:GNAT superfamily N-acetyltransferase
MPNVHDTFEIKFTELVFRKAEEKDLLQIIQMLASDELGRSRENPQNFKIYQKAFLEISADKNNFLAVVELDNKVIGTCHLTLMISLAIQASKRMNIEAVRVDDEFRGKGIGVWMLRKAIEFAKENEVKIIQLTTNKKRSEALRFYQKLGFVASHEGMKMLLDYEK